MNQVLRHVQYYKPLSIINVVRHWIEKEKLDNIAHQIYAITNITNPYQFSLFFRGLTLFLAD